MIPPRHESPEGYGREARELMEAGFRAYKIHPGVLPTKDVIEVVTLARIIVGGGVQLMLDPNCGYNFWKAFEVGRALDSNGFFWYEDPVAHYDLDAIGELSRRLDTPLCMSDRIPFNSLTERT